IADLRAAGAEIVDDFTVPGFETFPRPPQTPARSKADWENYFAYEGPNFPVRTVAELRDAPSGKGVHPLHAARAAPRKMPFATWAPGGNSIAAKIPSASTAAQTSKNFRYTCQSIALISV